MRDHVLLQAIARVNRPYEDDEGRRKTSGLILDFVGIFERLEAALAFDSEDVSGVVEGIDVLQRSWQRLMIRAREEFLPIAAGRVADKAVEAVLEHFRAPETRDGFYKFFRELEELYEILSPDTFLRDYVDDFSDLAAMYRLLRVSFEPNVDIDRSFLRKTADLVRQQTHSGRIIDPEKVYVLDQGVMEVLSDRNKPDTVKVFNLTKVLAQEVERNRGNQPYLVPIGERAAEVVRQFEERQLSTQDALDELTKLLGEVDRAEQMRQESDFGLEAFAIFWMLSRIELPSAAGIANTMDQEFIENPYWRQSPEQERRVRLKFYSALIGAGVDEARLTEIVDSVLNVLKRE
jgi:type I restriction enzyme R subunit